MAASVITGLFLFFCLLQSASAERQITAHPGYDVTLPCQAPYNAIITAVEWVRSNLDPDRYVYLREGGRLNTADQDPSYVNRVQLNDDVMRNGDLSLILKNVNSNDEGTYECRYEERGRWERGGQIKLVVIQDAGELQRIRITAYRGGTVTLPGRAPVGPSVKTVKWIKSGLQRYVFWKREAHVDPTDQDPFYVNRVWLKEDAMMANGELSLVLNNVNSNDEGRYMCSYTRTGDCYRDETFEPSCDVDLVVLEPPEPPCPGPCHEPCPGPTPKPPCHEPCPEPPPCPDPCPHQPCPHQPCPHQPCPEPCPHQPCPHQPCPHQPCPHQPCPDPCPLQPRPEPCPQQPRPEPPCPHQPHPEPPRPEPPRPEPPCPHQPRPEPPRPEPPRPRPCAESIQKPPNPERYVILPCRAPVGVPVKAVKWTRTDLQQYVFLKREEYLDPTHQHPSYVNRVWLKEDAMMKNGELSLVLNNVNSRDTGRYMCYYTTTGDGYRDETFKLTSAVWLNGIDPQILVESGQTVALPCRAPRNAIIRGVEWVRSDPDRQVYFKRGGRLVTADQDPSYVNRVQLEDDEMKNGELSLILKNVNKNDEGKYECRYLEGRGGRRKRAAFDDELISIVYLIVTGGNSRDGNHSESGKLSGRRDSSVIVPDLNKPGHLGVILPVTLIAALVAVGLVGFMIFKKRKGRSENNLDLPVDDSDVLQQLQEN